MEARDYIKRENDRITLDYGQSNAHIYVEKRIVKDVMRAHWHNYFELEIILGGCGKHILNGEEMQISTGSVYILNPTDFHSIIPSEPLLLWNVSFDEEMLSDRMLCDLSRADGNRTYTLNGTMLSRAAAIAELIGGESIEDGGGCSRELCESLLTVVMRSASTDTGVGRDQLSGIRRALLYLDVHFRENPSLAQTASHAGFHPNYFSELFKKVTGERYVDRLNTLRVGYAKTLLAKGFSVTETCYNSGFGSLSNFLTVFKARTGSSPENYKAERL